MTLGILRGKVVEVLHLRLFSARKKFYNALALFMVGFLLLVIREALEVAMDLGYLTFDAEGLVPADLGDCRTHPLRGLPLFYMDHLPGKPRFAQILGRIPSEIRCTGP
jgi:hypothetical protein